MQRPLSPAILWATTAVIAVAAITLPFGLGDHTLSVLVVAMMWAYLAASFNLIYGYTGLLPLGQALFFGIGAYTSTVLFQRYGLTPWIGMLVGGVLAAVAGVVISYVTFRYKVSGIYFALVTMGAAEVMRGLFNALNLAGGPSGIYLNLQDAPGKYFFLAREPYYFVILALLAAIVVVTYLLRRSRTGYELLALREDEDAAQASGVNTTSAKLRVIALSAFMTALGGTFYAQYLLYVQPDLVFTFDPTLNMMLGAMVGGSNTVLGPVLGSLVFSGVGELLRSLNLGSSGQAAALSRIIYGLLLTLVVLYLPDGLFSPWRLRRRRPPKAKPAREEAA